MRSPLNDRPGNGPWRRVRGLGAFLTALTVPALLAGPVMAAALSPKVELDRSVVLQGDKRPVYMLVEFDVPERKPEPGKERHVVNLALVIDRSGSMSQRGKLTYAKKAAKVVVDMLRPKDRLAVVEYDDRITVLWPSTPVEAPEMIKRRIDGLKPRGATNLTGGMMKGVEQVLEHVDAEGIHRVLLLSDGLANRGITRPAEIKRLVNESLRKGVSISTAGLGLRYDEDLMQAIAEHGGGNYYYIENPARMSRIFGQEMSTLYTTVAKNAKLVFTAGAAVDKVTVFGYRHGRDGRRTLVRMENFYGGEKRSVVFRLEVNADSVGDLNLGRLEVAYVDTEDTLPKTHTTELKVQVSADREVVVASRNKRVMAETLLTETEQRHEASVKLYEKGKRQEAKKRLAALAQEIAERNKELKDLGLAKKVEALRMETKLMDQAAASAAARQKYLKSTKQRLYQSKRGKRGKLLLKEGDRGLEVERLQEALRRRDIYKGSVDGRFTAEVTQAVREFQRRENLKPDGGAGPRTLRALKIY